MITFLGKNIKCNRNKAYICDVFRTLKGYQPSVDTTVVKRYGLSSQKKRIISNF